MWRKESGYPLVDFLDFLELVAVLHAVVVLEGDLLDGVDLGHHLHLLLRDGPQLLPARQLGELVVFVFWGNGGGMSYAWTSGRSASAPTASWAIPPAGC